MSRAARNAVKDVDVTLDLSDPHSREMETKPFPLSKKDDAKMALRQKREGSMIKTSGELTTMPDTNALAFTIRYLPGGRDRFLEFVKLAALNGDPSSKAFWAVYADLGLVQRRRCKFDDVAVAAGVKPSELLSGVVGHGMEASMDMGNLIAAALHPAVVAAAGKSALRIDSEIGAQDRQQLLQARGLLPVPKGTSIHLHANASASSTAAAAAHSEPSVPKFSDDIESLSVSRSEVQQQIAASTPVLDAETSD